MANIPIQSRNIISRVARELHDEAGQALTGLKIHLEMILSTLKRVTQDSHNEEVARLQEQMETVIQLCEHTMAQIRTLAHDLRPAALENMGLNATLKGVTMQV